MTIQQYMRKVQTDLIRFQQYVAKHPDDFPEEMSLDEWIEEFNDFHDPEDV